MSQNKDGVQEKHKKVDVYNYVSIILVLIITLIFIGIIRILIK